jgi:hypothetical protein
VTSERVQPKDEVAGAGELPLRVHRQHDSKRSIVDTARDAGCASRARSEAGRGRRGVEDRRAEESRPRRRGDGVELQSLYAAALS